jgi:hypothetical protein
MNYDVFLCGLECTNLGGVLGFKGWDTPFVFRHEIVLIVALAWFRVQCFMIKIRIFFEIL